MSRKMWCVFVDTDESYTGDHALEGKYNPTNNYFGVFLQERHAIDAAKRLAQRHSGRDVHVLEQKYGFISQPKPVEKKVWTPNGEFVPAS